MSLERYLKCGVDGGGTKAGGRAGTELTGAEGTRNPGDRFGGTHLVIRALGGAVRRIRSSRSSSAT